MSEAERAIHVLNGQLVIGRAVKVNYDTGKSDGRNKEKRVNNFSQGWHRDRDSSRTTETMNGSYTPTFDRWQRQDSERYWDDPVEEGRRIWVGGLPRIEGQLAFDESMQKVLAGFKIEAVHKVIPPGPKTRSLPGNLYYTFVDLGSVEEGERAVRELNGRRRPWSGLLRVQKARVNPDRKVLREQFAKE